MNRLLGGLAVLALVSPAAAGPAAGPAPGPPLTNEDVVRLVAAGRPEAEILRIIAASEVELELDPEMETELRRAGITERILTAMRERQATAGRSRPSLPAVPPVPRGKLRFSFSPLEESPRGETASFRMARKIPDWTRKRLGLPEKPEVEDLALFIACVTPEHVPDHWPDLTPVPDFPRHRLLHFAPGSHPERKQGLAVLALMLPSALSVEVPAGDHRLVVGIAARMGPDWRPVISDTRVGVRVDSGRTTAILVRLKGRPHGSRFRGFEEDRELRIDRVEPEENTP